MGMNPPGNGTRTDIEYMKEDIREIKASLKEIAAQIKAQDAVMNNHWTARDKEIAAIQQDLAVFKARIVTIGGAIAVIWTVGTFLAAKFL